MDKIIAKKREDGETQTLEEHTFMVIEEALNMLDDKELEFISQETNYDENKIKDLIFFGAYFHDIGKATKEFQVTIENGKRSYHSLYSSSLFSNITDFELDEEKGINMLMLCILTHHSIFNEGSIFKTVGNNKDFQFTFLSEAEYFFYGYKKAYKQYLNKNCNYDFEYKEINLKDLEKKIKDLYDDVESLRGLQNYNKIRLLYSYILGILNLADWIASSKFNNSFTNIGFEKLIDEKEVYERFEKAIEIEKFEPKDFQKKMWEHKGSILVEIPTGEGKTEGSFLWAINNIDSVKSRIIYTLPTQTTSNKLYERAKGIFLKDTGLIHSASKIYLEKQYEHENGKVDDKFDSDILFSTTFNKGITVSTIDSLFKYFLNLGRYNIAMVNFLRSVIIIDEVHSYDFKLMGFMKRFLEICSYYDVPVCLMSASIPNKIKQLLNINTLPVINDKDLFNKKANYIYKIDDCIENYLDHIIDEFMAGKDILIVRNKINKSVSTYKELVKRGINKDNIILYNSQFKKKDRVKKENEIYNKLKNKEHFILVATQVIEISLDIDFNVMYTDNAPIDALIQRFGRVNRKKKIDNLGKIFVFRDTEIKPYYSRMLEITYDTLDEGLFSLGKYTEWLNSVYDQLFIDKKVINEIESKFMEGYKKFDKVLESSHGISKSKDSYDLRDIEFPKKDFILVEDYDKNNFDYENTISLPVYLQNDYLFKEKDYTNGLYYDVLNLDYNYEIGVIIEDNMFI